MFQSWTLPQVTNLPEVIVYSLETWTKDYIHRRVDWNKNMGNSLPRLKQHGLRFRIQPTSVSRLKRVCFVQFGAALYLFFFLNGASQLFKKLHCDIQFWLT